MYYHVQKPKSLFFVNKLLLFLVCFYTFAHLKRRINDEKNKQKCKNLVITHREMCMKS